MRVEGTYTVRAEYGENNLATTTFGFVGSTATPPNNSKCGPGTIFNHDANSCVLIPIKKHLDSKLINEIASLQEKNTQLKLENKQLKNQINKLQLKIDNLQNIINDQIKIIMNVLVDFKEK